MIEPWWGGRPWSRSSSRCQLLRRTPHETVGQAIVFCGLPSSVGRTGAPTVSVGPSAFFWPVEFLDTTLIGLFFPELPPSLRPFQTRLFSARHGKAFDDAARVFGKQNFRGVVAIAGPDGFVRLVQVRAAMLRIVRVAGHHMHHAAV